MSQSELTEVVSLLRKENLNPKRAFGQNFLVDEEKIEQIISVLNPENYDITIEIGPGLGALTITLLGKARRMIAVEADRDMVRLLSQRIENASSLELINMPFEHYEPEGIEGNLLLVGNLPYNLTSKLLEKAIQYRAKTLGFMVQREVADKLEYRVGNNDANALACYLALLGKITSRIDVPRGAFYPVPKVDSAFIRIDIQNQVPFKAYLGLKKLFVSPNKKLSTVISSQIHDSESGERILSSFPELLNLRARQIEPERLLPLVLALENYR